MLFLAFFFIIYSCFTKVGGWGGGGIHTLLNNKYGIKTSSHPNKTKIPNLSLSDCQSYKI